jgi:hypothetical protein
LNVGLVQSNGNRLTRFSFETPEYHITTVLYVETQNIFLLISCVLIRSKFILVYFSHSESKIGCERQSYTVFLSSWKCVLRVNVNIMFCAVGIIVFDIMNVGLVQTNRNQLHVSLMNAWVSYISGFVCRKTKFFFLWCRVCYYAVSLFLYIFRIPNLRLVGNYKDIGFFPAHENTILNKCQYHKFRAVVIIVWRSECSSCSKESKSDAIFSYKMADYRI